MKGCHSSKIVARDGEFYCGPYRVYPEGDYVSFDMVAFDSMTPKQRANWHLRSDGDYDRQTERKLKEAGL